MKTLVGTTLSHYRVTQELGSGGMGVVYLAHDLRLDRTVAIKLLSDELHEDAQARQRFVHEARAASSLDHPNICAIYEIDETPDGRDYIVMAHYEGTPLDRHMESGPLPLGEALGIATQVAEGLGKAHASGVVHRDIKPSNLMLTADGVVKILDFGLAKVKDLTSLTSKHQVLGTPAYMAPEQYRSERAHPTVDVWSTGVLLYHLLAGEPPFKGDTPAAVMYSTLATEPAPLGTLAPHIPAELESIVRRCLDKDPSQRFQDGRQLVTALKQALQRVYAGPAALEVAPIPKVAVRALAPSTHAHRIPRPLVVAGVIAVPLLLLLGGRLVLAKREPLRVAVAPPRVSTAVDSVEAQLASSAIQSALLRGLAGFKGIAVVDPSELRSAGSDPAAIATSVSADEVVSGTLEASPEEWHVRLRWTTKRNMVRWADEVSVPREDPLILANAVIARLPQAYPRLPRRAGLKPIRVRPEDYAAFLELFQLSVHATPVQLDQKFRAFDGLHRRAPTFVDAYLADARFSLYAYQVSRNPAHLERARAVADQAYAIAPDDPRAVAKSLEVALVRRDIGLASRRLGEMEQLDPGNPQVDYDRALLEEETGQVDEALAIMNRLVEHHPSVTNLRYLVDMEYRNGRVDAARGHLGQLIGRFPDDAYAYSKLAQLELLYGSAARADSLYTEVLRRTPSSPPALNNRGLARMLMGHYPNALEDFRAAFIQNPTKAVYLLNVADCEALVGRADSARVHYTRLLEIAKRDPSGPSLMWRAQSLAHLGRRQEAVAAAQEGLRLEPEDSEALYQAALVYTLVGDHESALVDARKAVDKGVDPRWFSLDWFDPLRSDTAFVRIMTPRV